MSPDTSKRIPSILGASSLVVGNINGDGDLEIRGKVQGDIRTTGLIRVSSTGIVIGQLEGRALEVAGQVRGDLRADDGVEITNSGQVVGQIEAPRVGIEAGAVVRGQLITGRLQDIKQDKKVEEPETTTLGSFIKRPPSAASEAVAQTLDEKDVSSSEPKIQLAQSEAASDTTQPSATKRKTSKRKLPNTSARQARKKEPTAEPAENAVTEAYVHAAQETRLDEKPKPLRKRKRKPRNSDPEKKQAQSPLSDTQAPKSKGSDESTSQQVVQAPSSTEDSPKPAMSPRHKKTDTPKKAKLKESASGESSKRIGPASGKAPPLPTFTKGTKGHRRST